MSRNASDAMVTRSQCLVVRKARKTVHKRQTDYRVPKISLYDFRPLCMFHIDGPSRQKVYGPALLVVCPACQQ